MWNDCIYLHLQYEILFVFVSAISVIYIVTILTMEDITSDPQQYFITWYGTKTSQQWTVIIIIKVRCQMWQLKYNQFKQKVGSVCFSPKNKERHLIIKKIEKRQNLIKNWANTTDVMIIYILDWALFLI